MITFDLCYRFTNIIGNKKFAETTDVPPERLSRKRRRLSSPDAEESSVWLYPDHCQICGKYRIQQRRGKSLYPHKILTLNAEAAIKNSAKLKDLVHYAEIVNVDLVAKEYKVHDSCYKKFVITKSTLDEASKLQSEGASESHKNAPYAVSNFDEVKEFVSDIILQDQRAVSISSLHDIYGLGIGKNLNLEDCQ